jgi:hypothetical protein
MAPPAATDRSRRPILTSNHLRVQQNPPIAIVVVAPERAPARERCAGALRQPAGNRRAVCRIYSGPSSTADDESADRRHHRSDRFLRSFVVALAGPSYRIHPVSPTARRDRRENQPTFLLSQGTACRAAHKLRKCASERAAVSPVDAESLPIL